MAHSNDYLMIWSLLVDVSATGTILRSTLSTLAVHCKSYMAALVNIGLGIRSWEPTLPLPPQDRKFGFQADLDSGSKVGTIWLGNEQGSSWAPVLGRIVFLLLDLYSVCIASQGAKKFCKNSRRTLSLMMFESWVCYACNYLFYKQKFVFQQYIRPSDIFYFWCK